MTLEIINNFQADLEAGPRWVFWWVNFMGLVIAGAIPFAFFRAEARWTIIAMLATFPTMMWLYSIFGYARILGLAHVIFWTPLAIYFWCRRKMWSVANTLSGKWIALWFTVMCVSLIFDYTDVARFLLGDRN